MKRRPVAHAKTLSSSLSPHRHLQCEEDHERVPAWPEEHPWTPHAWGQRQGYFGQCGVDSSCHVRIYLYIFFYSGVDLRILSYFLLFSFFSFSIFFFPFVLSFHSLQPMSLNPSSLGPFTFSLPFPLPFSLPFLVMFTDPTPPFYFHRNGANLVMNLGAWAFTGSHSLFAEALHSLADVTNQLILAYGIHKSKQVRKGCFLCVRRELVSYNERYIMYNYRDILFWCDTSEFQLCLRSESFCWFLDATLCSRVL